MPELGSAVPALVFWGSALLAAGLFVCMFAVGVCMRHIHERKHRTASGNGCGLALLLTFVTAAACTLFVYAHARDADMYCSTLNEALEHHQRALTTIAIPDGM